jgi:hydroxyacylglutathione hydrolase
MIHEILAVGPLQCNCSIIGDETTHEAMVIDPGDEIQTVLTIVRKHNLQVKQIVITHAHIDHVGGAMKLRAATGAPILLNQNDYELLKMLDMQATWIGVPPPGKVDIDQSIGQADTVKAGSLTANVISTPGHTEGSICLYFPVEKKLIAGDTLFAEASVEPIFPAALSRRSSIPCTTNCSPFRMTPSSFPATARKRRSARSARIIPF